MFSCTYQPITKMHSVCNFLQIHFAPKSSAKANIMKMKKLKVPPRRNDAVHFSKRVMQRIRTWAQAKKSFSVKPLAGLCRTHLVKVEKWSWAVRYFFPRRKIKTTALQLLLVLQDTQWYPYQSALKEHWASVPNQNYPPSISIRDLEEKPWSSGRLTAPSKF